MVVPHEDNTRGIASGAKIHNLLMEVFENALRPCPEYHIEGNGSMMLLKSK